MEEYPEDKWYPSNLVEYSYVFEGNIPSHPSFIRDMWGAIPVWMEWTGDKLNSDSYAGLYKQDEIFPFIFWGGGFDSISSFNGPYIFICPPTASIPKNINLGSIYDPLSGLRFGSYDNTNNEIEIRSNDGSKKIKCSSQPVEHFSSLYERRSKYAEISPYVEREFATFFDRIIQSRFPIPSELEGYVELPNQYSEHARTVAKIDRLYQLKGQTIVILSLVTINKREEWVDKPLMEKKDWVFSEWEFIVPPQVEIYLKEIKTDNISYLNSIVMDEFNSSLIFSNGLYLLNRPGTEPKNIPNPFRSDQ